MFIITDAHVSLANGNVDAFFEMLAAVAQLPHDVVFLGDIFDLWIALDRYEEPIQTRFLEWCNAFRNTRNLGFIEGNHEFYVVTRHRDAFSWSSEWGRRMDDLLFVHGDLINGADRNYLRWRKVSKNRFTRNLVRILPGGPSLVLRLKQKMKKTNKAFRLGLPREALERFTQDCAATGVRRVFVGHFHQAFNYRHEECILDILPDWFADGSISFYDRKEDRLYSGAWREVVSSVGT